MCIRVLATEIFGKILTASTRTHGRGEETLLSSGWTHYLNVIIKPLCGSLGVCLNYCFRSRNSVRVLSVADRDRK